MEIAEAFITVRPKLDPNANADIAKAGQQAGTAFADGVTKDAQGRLRDARGKFVTSGQQLGEGVGQGISKGVKSQTSEVVKDLGAVFALFGAGRFLKSAFAEATEATRATAQVGAVLKSTGAEAGVSADHVDRLAQSESAKIAVDDDVIKRGEAMLLTFRSVRNEVGAGNQIFDRGTKAAADMAAVYGNDLQGAVVQVGKALEDPILGLTQLRRVGVEFTAQQRDQIKTLVASGDLLSAQKIILGELEKEFGGAAQKIAEADPFQRFNVEGQRFKETVGRDVLPAASGVLGVVSNFLDVFGQAPAPIRGTAEALVGLGVGAAVVARFSPVFGAFRESLAAAAEGEGLLAVATTGLKASMLGLGLGVAGIASVFALIDSTGKKSIDVDRLKVAFDALAKSEAFSGVLSDNFGKDAKELGSLIDLAKHEGPGFLGQMSKIAYFLTDPFTSSGGHTEIQHAKDDFAALDTQLAELAKGGHSKEAGVVFSYLSQKAQEQGKSVGDLTKLLPDYEGALKDIDLQQRVSANSAQTLTERYTGLLNSLITPLTEKLGVEDALAAAADAARDLKEAKDETAGTGPKALAAAQAETDAQHSLADAYNSSSDAVRHLQDAQAKLAEFNNADSQRIRDLERLQITRRVVTSPEEARQKQIDLLHFDQQAADQRRDLQRGVEDAERGVQDAAGRVADAQGKVAQAAQKRKQVQVEAAKAIEGAERKAEEAVLAAGTALGQFAQDAQPGDTVLGSYLESLRNIAALVDPSGALVKNLDLLLVKLHGLPFQPIGGNANPFTQSISPDQAYRVAYAQRGGGEEKLTFEQWAHSHHVPGYEFGGIVPGPLGAPQLAVVHGGEEVRTPDQQHAEAFHFNPEYHFHGGDYPTRMELDWINHGLAKQIGRRKGF